MSHVSTGQPAGVLSLGPHAPVPRVRSAVNEPPSSSRPVDAVADAASAGARSWAAGRGVVLLAESAGLSLQVVMCLAQMGARIHVLARPAAMPLRWSRHCESVTLFDFHPDVTPLEVTRQHIAKLAATRGIDVAVPVSGLSGMVLDRLGRELPVRCFPVGRSAVIDQLGDKWSFDALCRQHGIAAPRTVQCTGRQAITPELAAQIGFPLVVKPADLGDSVGVVIARDLQELRHKVVDNPDYGFERLVVQQFVPGREIDLSVLAIDGQVVAHAVQHRVGRTVVFTEDADLLAAGTALIAATGYDGLAHFDAICDARDGRCYLLECNTRAWGSIAAAAFCGLNFIEAGLAVALDRPLPTGTIPAGASYLSPPHALLGMFRQPLSPATRAGLRLACRDPIGTAAIALTPSGRRGRWP